MDIDEVVGKTEKHNIKHFNIITLSGHIGVGKDLVANYIQMKYGFYKYAYADKLKSILENAGWDGNKDEHGRKLLQSVGKAFRDYDEDFWIKKLAYDIHIHTFNESFHNIVISDARHINEIEKISGYIELENPNYSVDKLITIGIKGNNYSDRYTDEKINSDISEIGLDNYSFKYIINNNTSKDCVFEQVKSIMKNEGFNTIVIPELC